MRSLRAKLLIAFCVAEALIIAVIVGVVSGQLRRDTNAQKEFVGETLEARAQESLQGHLRLLELLLEEDRQDCLQAVESATQNPRLLAALERFDVKVLQHFLYATATIAEMDLMVLYDQDGTVVASYPATVDELAATDYFATWGPGQQIQKLSLSEDAWAAGVLTGTVALDAEFLRLHGLPNPADLGATLGHLVLQVVVDDFGEPIGFAAVVKRLDGYHVPFQRARRISDYGVALYLGGVPLAWAGFGAGSDGGEGGVVVPPTLDSVVLAEIAATEGAWHENLPFPGGTVLAVTSLVEGLGEAPAGLLLATLPQAELQEAADRLGATSDAMLSGVRTGVLLVGAGAMVGFFLITLLIESRLITRPLAAVEEGLGDLAQGEADLTRSLPVSTRDEVGRLAGNFNSFLERMRDWVLRTRITSSEIRETVATIQSSSQVVHNGARDQTEHLEASHGAVLAIGEGAASIEERTLVLVTATETSSSATQQMGATAQEIAAKMDELFRLVDQVSSSIHQMSSVSGQVSHSVETLAATAQQTAASIAEMDQNMGRVRRGADRTGEVAEAAARDARSGKQAVDATVAGVEALSGMVEDSTGVIRELARRSGQIGGILTTISDIAEQTNLLALNASIIAAQAGRHGTGFGVVANEIKALAASTKNSAKEITGIVGGLQEVAQKAVESTESGRSQALEELERAREAGSRLDLIIASSDESLGQAEEIVRATQEHAESSGQIIRAVDRVGDMLGQITAAVQEQVDGYRVLAGASDAMRDIASEVKIGTDEQALGSNQIADSMEHVRSMLDEIDTATREQTGRSQSVLDSVASALEVARRHADLSAEFDTAVATLTRQAETLSREVDAFKT